MQKSIFKIRNREGLFSTGGTIPKFTKTGKIWSTSGALSNHLVIIGKYGTQLYNKEGAEIVTYEVVETEVMVESLQGRINAMQAP